MTDHVDPTDIPQRKLDHVEITARQPTTGATPPGWGDIRLLHNCLPEIDKDAVDLRTPLLGHTLAAPVIIASMTGGHPAAAPINATLARAAQRFGLGLGVGSQRAGLRRPELLPTYAVAREAAPDALVLANVGLPQLIDQDSEPALTLEQVRLAVDSLRADGLVVHLNYLQEVVQPEGDKRAAGALAALRRLCTAIHVPVVAKETGAGMLRTQGAMLVRAGVAALDVGGAGGTSFAVVEGVRAGQRGQALGARLGELYAGWGIPTAVSVVETVALGPPVIATGGIRSGLDAAKALALGATAVGVARPALSAALEGDDALAAWLEGFLEELRVALFLTGSRDVATLRRQPRVILGDTAAWLRQLGHLV